MQRIENRCTSSALTKFASWTDRDNTNNYFWHGNHNTTDEGCRCAFEGECSSFGLMKTMCNCDGFGQDAIDNGEITSMLKLPITKLNYGTSIPNGKINYYLGPMICSGKRGYFPSENNKVEKQKIQNQMQNITNDLQKTQTSVQSDISKLRSEVDILNTTLNQTVHQLINVTSINQSISRQKRDCDDNLNRFVQIFDSAEIPRSLDDFQK